MKQKKTGFAYLLSYATSFKNYYVLSIVIALISVASGLLPYFSISKIIFLLINNTRDFNDYIIWIALTIVGYCFKNISHNISTTFSHLATFKVISIIRKKIASKLTRVPMGFVLNTPSGKFKNSIVEKVDAIEPSLAHVLPEMTSNLLIPIFTLSYIFILDWKMGFVSLITLPIGGYCYSKMMDGYEVKYAGLVAASKHMNATAVEYINGIEVFKAFNQSTSSYNKYREAVEENANYGLRWMKSVQIYSSLGFGILPAVLIGILPIGCLFYIDNTLTLQSYLTIIILSMGIVPPLISALYYMDDIAKINTTMVDIGCIIESDELVRPTKSIEINGGDIELKNIKFSYDNTEILHGINLTFKRNTINALVGPSGSGKSTIAKLIASFWDINSGTISIDGINIVNLSSEELMNNIAYVAQDNYLFDDTILENIRMGDLSASDDDVINIAKKAGCHDFIMSLENDYNTITGGAGSHLSGGERQRIAIARAMLKDAPIIILDEATAYTDPENEAIIQSSIAKLIDDKTLIVIAHRLSTIIDSDQIIVVDNGTINATGTHENLLKRSQLYSELWQSHIQTKDEL